MLWFNVFSIFSNVKPLFPYVKALFPYPTIANIFDSVIKNVEQLIDLIFLKSQFIASTDFFLQNCLVSLRWMYNKRESGLWAVFL